MKSFIIYSLLFCLIIGIVLLLIKNPYLLNKNQINWNLELTTPSDYEIENIKLLYYYKGHEIKRSTARSNDGWNGILYGNVLFIKEKEFLPDSVKLSWSEAQSKTKFNIDFAFPKEKVIEYWTTTNKLNKKQWGNHFTEDQLRLKLGISSKGLITLWFSGLDINTTFFAIEVESYMVKQNTNPITKVLQERYSEPFFSTFNETDKNIVSIHIDYFNGEQQTINKKKSNNSLLEAINNKRGWGIAKKISVTWFDKKNEGYRSVYEVNENQIPQSINQSTHLIYLLDHSNKKNKSWESFEEKHFLFLTESKRELQDARKRN